MNTEQIAYSVEEAMRITRIGRTRFYQEINSGKLRTFKAGRRRLVSAEALYDWVHRLEAEQLQESATESE